MSLKTSDKKSKDEKPRKDEIRKRLANLSGVILDGKWFMLYMLVLLNLNIV
jgi:hypothetical protein